MLCSIFARLLLFWAKRSRLRLLTSARLKVTTRRAAVLKYLHRFRYAPDADFITRRSWPKPERVSYLLTVFQSTTDLRKTVQPVLTSRLRFQAYQTDIPDISAFVSYRFKSSRCLGIALFNAFYTFGDGSGNLLESVRLVS